MYLIELTSMLEYEREQLAAVMAQRDKYETDLYGCRLKAARLLLAVSSDLTSAVPYVNMHLGDEIREVLKGEKNE